MNLLLDGEHPVLKALSIQFTAAKILRRELSGAGFFVYFDVPSSCPRVEGRKAFDLGDVSAEIHGLAHGAGFQLHVRDGVLGSLEAYSYDESWPTEDKEFTLTYVRWESVLENPLRLAGGKPTQVRDMTTLTLIIG